MNRPFRILSCLLLLTCTAGMSHAAIDENGNRFVYLAGTENVGNSYSNSLPIASEAEQWASNRMFETSPGSNVYEITKDISTLAWGRWIRFYSDLADDIPEGQEHQAYNMNLIQPASARDTRLYPLPNGILYTTEVAQTKYSQATGCFELPTSGTYRIRLDLNDNSMTAIPQDTYLAVVNETFDKSRLHEYPAIGNLANYYPAGDLSFSIYAAFDNTWMQPKTADFAILSTGENIAFRTTIGSPEPGELFKVPDWTGGVLIGHSFNLSGTATATGKISILPDDTDLPIDRDRIIIQTPWQSFTPDNSSSNVALSCFPALTANGDGSYSGSLYVPAGHFRLRLIDAIDSAADHLSIIAPPGGTDRELNAVGGVAYSSADILNDTEAGYWTFNDVRGWDGGYVNITFTRDARNSVKFEWNSTEASPNTQLYVIGTPNDWRIDESSIILLPTTKGGFYGSFEAEASNLIFRFYSALGDWESNTYGSIVDDMVGDTWDASEEYTHYANCIAGKGNYQIDNWPGGTLYAYVDLKDASVRFSTSPMADVGDIINPEDIKQFYLYNNGQYTEFERSPNGLYTADIYSADYNAGLNFRIFTKKLPITTEEPEWGGSYSLAPISDAPAEFDQFNVAEIAYTNRDEVTTDGGTPFRVAEGANGYRFKLALDADANTLYVERLDHQIILYGDITDGEIPTYSTRENFRNTIINPTGAPVTVPAGNTRVAALRSFAYAPAKLPELTSYPVNPADSCAITMDRIGVSLMYENYVEIQNWKGGKLFIAPGFIFAPSIINELTASKYDQQGWAQESITSTQPGSGIFKGTMHFDGKTSFSFNKNIDEQHVLWFGPIITMPGVGYPKPIFDGCQNIITENGEASAQIGISGFSFLLPALTGTGDLDYTLDLNAGTLSVSVPRTSEGQIYEVVSDNDSSIDGAVAYPSQEKNDAVVVTATADNANSTEDRTIEFNFTSPDGSSIYPAEESDTEITFDESGTWQGKFTSRKTMAKSRAAARRAAAAQSAWLMNIPAGQASSLAIMLDEATSTITVASSAHNKGFFIIPTTTLYNQKMIENIESLKQDMLRPTEEEGVYEGYMHLTAPSADTPVNFVISRGIDGTGSLSRAFTSQALNVIEKDDVDETIVTEMSYSSYLELCTSFDTIKFRYDAPAQTLTASYDPSGVEQMAVNGLSIYLCHGGITVESDAETAIAIYTLTGQMAAYRNIAPGTNFIQLPAGFYITEGRKILVR